MKNGKTPDGYTVNAKGVWLKDIPQEVKKVQKETENARTTVENSQRDTHSKSDHRREDVTRELNTSSVLEKQANEGESIIKKSKTILGRSEYYNFSGSGNSCG